MLQVQKFIRSHENWEELLAAEPYFLSIHRDGNLIILKYTQGESDYREEIVRECRGIILEDKTFETVCVPFFKFFVLGGEFQNEIDWDSASASLKIDGSLIKVFFYNGKWRVATNGAIDAYKAHVSDYNFDKTFGEIFDAAAKNSGFNFDKLDPNYTYCFELVSPETQVIIPYKETKLYHLATRHNKTFKEIEVDIGVEKPQYFKFNSQEDYEALLTSLAAAEDIVEGLVVKDKFNNRVKLKTERYFTFHYINNNNNVRRDEVLNLVKKDDVEELLLYFPKYKEVVKEVQYNYDKLHRLASYIQFDVANYKSQLFLTLDEVGVRKKFAENINKNHKKFAYFYFLAYDGVNLTKRIEETPSKFIIERYFPLIEDLTF